MKHIDFFSWLEEKGIIMDWDRYHPYDDFNADCEGWELLQKELPNLNCLFKQFSEEVTTPRELEDIYRKWILAAKDQLAISRSIEKKRKKVKTKVDTYILRNISLLYFIRRWRNKKGKIKMFFEKPLLIEDLFRKDIIIPQPPIETDRLVVFDDDIWWVYTTPYYLGSYDFAVKFSE